MSFKPMIRPFKHSNSDRPVKLSVSPDPIWNINLQDPTISNVNLNLMSGEKPGSNGLFPLLEIPLCCFGLIDKCSKPYCTERHLTIGNVFKNDVFIQMFRHPGGVKVVVSSDVSYYYLLLFFLHTDAP